MIDLRVGYRCNQACRFCDQGDWRDSRGDADTATVLAAMPAGEGIWLAGGEVTLRPDLPALIQAARARGHRRVGVQTNGRIFAARGAALGLRRLGLTDAAVALHGDEATHDWLVGSPGWKLSVAGIRQLVAAGVVTGVNTVVTRSTDIVALARWLPALGVRWHRWIVARGALAPRLSLVAEPLREALREEREAGLEAETVGLPLCLLGEARDAAADRRDLPEVRRVFPPGFEEEPHPRVQGPPCADCRLRHACAGVDAAYAARWGWEEIGPSPTPAVAEIGGGGREARQQLVRAKLGGAVAVRFTEPSERLVAEAARLGLRVE